MDALLPMAGLKSLEPKESQLEKLVCEYFNYQKFGVKKIPMAGYFDEKKRKWRRHQNPFVANGISDLIVLHCGVTYFVEIKTKKGTQRADQKAFQVFTAYYGCRYFICRSFEDAETIAKEIKFGIKA
jgi:hypothetical protein